MTERRDKRSDAITKGPTRAPARAMLRGAGLTDADLEKPLIAVVNTWSTVTPCNLHLADLAEPVRRGVRAGGGVPIDFNTIVVSDGITMGAEGMRASLISREAIADSIELAVRGHSLDGVVVMVGCDKTIPAAAMALARLDIPGVVFYGGTIMPGRCEGKDISIQDVFEAVGAHAAGTIGDEKLDEIERAACPGAGACGGQFTANTMAMALAFLGLAPMGAGDPPALDPSKAEEAERCGRLCAALVLSGANARRFITPAALRNAVASVAASGGSTNAVLHFAAIAAEAGEPFSIDLFDEVSQRTPVIVDMKPTGRFLARDLYAAGGARLPQGDRGGAGAGGGGSGGLKAALFQFAWFKEVRSCSACFLLHRRSLRSAPVRPFGRRPRCIRPRRGKPAIKARHAFASRRLRTVHHAATSSNPRAIPV